MNADQLERPPRAEVYRRDLLRYGAIIGGVGLVLWLIGLSMEPRRALAAYLVAYATLVTMLVGALMLVMISYVTGARWFAVLRQPMLVATGAMPVTAMLALPFLLGVSILYPWADVTRLPLELRSIVARKAGWLNTGFFVARAVVYLGTWVALGTALRRLSLSRAEAGSDINRVTRRLQRLSVAGLIAAGLTLTFASFDWLMSLEPTWYSTVYGVYVFAGGTLAAGALATVLGWDEWRLYRGKESPVSPEHFSALGKLLFTFAMFWAYIAFAQYLIIWIGDLPSEVSWYVDRSSHGWGVLGLVVAAGQFALPCIVLLSRTFRRQPRRMAALGVWLLAMHALDVYWLVLPSIDPQSVRPSWLDAVALVAVGGLVMASAARRAERLPALPLGDPSLDASLRYTDP